MDIQKLIDEYATWLRKEITFEKVGEYYEITTPYLDSANDYLQIYVRQDGDELYFTDDSATINNLKMSGFQLTAARKKHLQRILNQYGVKLNGDELIAKAPANSFAQKKHLFIWMIFKSSLMRKKSTIQIMFNLQEYQDLHTIMTFYFKGVEQNRRDCAKQLIIPINPAWETSCLRGMTQNLPEKMGANLLLS